ncbi:MAG: hypothetical protein L3J76_00360 [Candidatus Hydrothermae bacterium]|nr:hypothetical protein [Candidatus Hydrothermae bacterium]
MTLRDQLLGSLESLTVSEMETLWEALRRVEVRKLLREQKKKKKKPRTKDAYIQDLRDRMQTLTREDWKHFQELFYRMRLIQLLEETWKKLEAERGENVSFKDLVREVQKEVKRSDEFRKHLKDMTRKELQEVVKAFTRMRLLRALEGSLEVDNL